MQVEVLSISCRWIVHLAAATPANRHRCQKSLAMAAEVQRKCRNLGDMHLALGKRIVPFFFGKPLPILLQLFKTLTPQASCAVQSAALL